MYASWPSRVDCTPSTTQSRRTEQANTKAGLSSYSSLECCFSYRLVPLKGHPGHRPIDEQYVHVHVTRRYCGVSYPPRPAKHNGATSAYCTAFATDNDVGKTTPSRKKRVGCLYNPKKVAAFARRRAMSSVFLAWARRSKLLAM